MRIPYVGGTLDVYEAVTSCALCSTVRTLWRDQVDESFVQATYAYPDGYLAPPGMTWDRAQLKLVWRRRHPASGRTRVVGRG